MKHTTVNSVPAIVGGTAAAGAAVALLVRDGWNTGFTLEHFLMPVLVGLTVLSAHLAWDAFRNWRELSGIAFAVLAVFGSLLTVYETTGRRAEVRDTKVASAQKSVEEVARISRDLVLTRELVAESQKAVGLECASGRGKKCDGLTFVLDQRQASLEKLEGLMEHLKAPAPVDPKAERVAFVAGLFHYDPIKVKAMVAGFDPMTFPMFLELSSIFLFGYGFNGRKATEVFSLKASEVAEQISEVSTEVQEKPLSAEEIALIRALRKARRPVNNGELASFMGVSPSEASKRRAAYPHLVSEERVGREVRCALAEGYATVH